MLKYEQLWQIQEPILALSVFIEAWLHSTPNLRRWRESTFRAWYRLQTISWPKKSEVNAAFQRRFQQLFGDRLLSWRRVCIGSIFSVVTVILALMAIGYSYQIFAGSAVTVIRFQAWTKTIAGFFGLSEGAFPYYSIHSIIYVVYDGIGFNIIPDLISLTETGWIISKASKPNASIFKLTILDLVLTTAIWFIWHLASLIVINGGHISIDQWLFFYRIYGIGGVGVGQGWIWILTTYSTSLLWILFLVTTLGLATLRRGSSIAVRILESRIIFELPILSIIGAICISIWPILFIFRMIFPNN